MPLNTDSSFGLLKSSVGGFFGNSIKSPFWLALIITVIILLITIFVYPAKKTSSLSKLFKLMIYIFITTLVFLFLHDNAIKEVWLTEHEDKKARDVLSGMTDFIANGNKPVIPEKFGEVPVTNGSDPRIGSTNLISSI